jgi:hypothetical protein
MPTINDILNVVIAFLGGLWDAVSPSIGAILEAFGTLAGHWSGWVLGQG